MSAVEIKPGIYWVGAVDWGVRDFHGYNTARGTSYNAYLIVDETVVLVDTVKETHYDEMMRRIKSVIDPSKIDMIISNHVEMDHSGGIPNLLKIIPNARLITSKNGKKGLSMHFDTSGWNIEAVDSGSKIDIGKRSIQFLHTPMLHWPDSMVSYIAQDKLLLPNDAFGQHFASGYLFDDENPMDVIFEEAAKYYANIVYPFGMQVNKALSAVADLEIDMVAPSHGIIWRKNFAKILEKYAGWANAQNSNKALVVYDSMWGSTEQMANAIRIGFEENGIPVVMRSLKSSHISDVMNDMLESRYVAIGSSTLNNQVLPTVAGFLSYMKGLKPLGKTGIAFGSYGWNSRILNDILSVMEGLKWNIGIEAVNLNYRPDSGQLQDLKDSISSLIKKH